MGVRPAYDPNGALDDSCYQTTDIVSFSQFLLGKKLCSFFDGQLTAGIVVETEAYRAEDDKGSHAFGNKITPRTKVLFERGGRAYIYLCYGIHHMFNVVSGPKGVGNATLVRAIEPIDGIDLMMHRRRKSHLSPRLTSGPGCLGQALGMHKNMTGLKLYGSDAQIWLEPGMDVTEFEINQGPRIGIDYAEECVNWPWRYWIKDNKWVSKVRR